jgi:hypothetical protein
MYINVMPRKKYSNFTWSDGQVNELIRLWPEKSASQIGRLINKSRSAVLGKVKRLKLKK